MPLVPLAPSPFAGADPWLLATLVLAAVSVGLEAVRRVRKQKH